MKKSRKKNILVLQRPQRMRPFACLQDCFAKPDMPLSLHVSRPATDEVGMSKNNTHLNFGFLFGLINGIIDTIDTVILNIM